jgi:hypothetical protein
VRKARESTKLQNECVVNTKETGEPIEDKQRTLLTTDKEQEHFIGGSTKQTIT